MMMAQRLRARRARRIDDSLLSSRRAVALLREVARKYCDADGLGNIYNYISHEGARGGGVAEGTAVERLVERGWTSVKSGRRRGRGF